MHDILLLINSGSSLFMMGLIWFIQLVHYPSFRNVGEKNFKQFHRNHVFRTGLVVVPVMLTELVTSGILSVLSSPVSIFNRTGLGIVLLIWIVTALVQAPIHRNLQFGYNIEEIDRLIRTNWIRTVFWTIKALLSLFVTCYLPFNWGN